MPPSRQPGGVMLAAAGPALLCLCLTASPLPSPQSPDGQTVQTAARAVGAAQPANSVQPAGGHEFTIGIPNNMEVAGKDIPTDGKGNYDTSACDDDRPLCKQYYSDKVFEWLPLWRWTRTTWLFSDLDADTGWLMRKVGVGNIADLFVGLIVQLPLQIAGFIWELISYLIYLALTPTFYTRLFYFTYGKAAELWVKNFRPLFMGGTGATMWAALLVIGVTLAMWQMLKSRTTAGAGSKLPWMQAFGTLMRVLIPLTLVYMMVTNPTGELGPQRIMERTMRYTDYVAEPIKDGVTAFTDNIGNRGAATACTAYKQTLEAIFLSAWTNQNEALKEKFEHFLTAGRAGSGPIKKATDELGALTGSTNETITDILEQKFVTRYQDTSITVSDPGIRAYLPILASRMWENGFHHGLGMAQFGDPVAASRGTCYLSEWRAKSTDATEQQAIFNLSGVVYPTGADSQISLTLPASCPGATPPPSCFSNPAQAAEDRLHPDSHDAERSLLTLAVACGLVDKSKAEKSTNPSVPTDSSDMQTEYTPNPGTPNPGDPVHLETSSVWLDPGWAGMFNNKTRALFWSTDYAISSGVCAAWANIDCGSACSDPSWDNANYGNRSRLITGVNANWIQEKANITMGDLKRSLETRRALTSVSGAPSAGDEERVREIVRSIQGLNVMKRVLFAVVSVLTAIVFLYALGGLTLGVLVAQFILALTLMMLPVLVFATAFPHAGARKLQKKLIRVWIFASLSYAIFFVTLAVLMLLITLTHSIAVAALPTSEGGLLDILLTPFTVLLSVKLLKSVAKTFGGDITSFKGAMEFTSGMAAAGVKLPDPKTFVSDTMKPLTSPTIKGAKMYREGKYYLKKAREDEIDPNTGRPTGRKKGFVGGSLNEVWKNKVVEPLEAKTRSGAVKYRKEIDDDAYRLGEIEAQTEGYATERERLREQAAAKERERLHGERVDNLVALNEQTIDPATGVLSSVIERLTEMEDAALDPSNPEHAIYDLAGDEITELAESVRQTSTAMQKLQDCIDNNATREELVEAEQDVARAQTRQAVASRSLSDKQEDLITRGTVGGDPAALRTANHIYYSNVEELFARHTDNEMDLREESGR